MGNAPVILWFRRDLRVADQPLLESASDRPVVPLFVLDPALLDATRIGASRRAYLADALGDLDASLRRLGGRLIVRRGDAATVLPALAAEVGATTVRWAADVSPYARRRDRKVRDRLAADRREVIEHEGVLVHEPGSVTRGDGSPYRVFTPFHRVWQRLPLRPVVDPPSRIRVAEDVQTDPVPTRKDLAPDLQITIAGGGETAAQTRLDRFLEDRVAGYAHARDLLAEEGTSRLSADLHYGTISPIEIIDRTRPDDAGDRAYVRELAFRDFYAHVLHAFPQVRRVEFDETFRDLPWRTDPDDFAAWTEGRTGFPVVDAAMRQLRDSAWMHNRARMIVASFLCKDLLIDWRLGERHFLRHLVDADVANNNGGWQWAAGTGTDAQPYFRIFNPVTQGQRYDPDGAYVRRWVPELTAVPTKWIHRPWEMPGDQARACGVVVGQDYPAPMVDHRAARQRALDWFATHRRERGQ